jgi:hypothetical protein
MLQASGYILQAASSKPNLKYWLVGQFSGLMALNQK